jgi:hypothetical protein
MTRPCSLSLSFRDSDNRLPPAYDGSAATLRAAESDPRKISIGRTTEIRRTLRDEAAIVDRGTPLAVRLEVAGFHANGPAKT